MKWKFEPYWRQKCFWQIGMPSMSKSNQKDFKNYAKRGVTTCPGLTVQEHFKHGQRGKYTKWEAEELLA